jgi:phosphoribosylformylglycinamidine synthase I
VPDVHKTVTMDFKASGSRVYVVGETEAELGASLYAILNNQSGGKAPQPKPDALSTFRTLHRAITSGLVPACHDCAEGGLAVALAEMSLAGGIGVEAALDKVPGGAELTDTEILFSESLSRFVVEVDSEQTAAFEQLMRAAHIPLGQIGTTTENNFTIQGRDGERLIDVSPAELEQAWRGHIEPRGRGAEEQRGTRFSPAPLPPRSSAPSHTPRVLILHANGTNRDQDAALACQLAGGDPEIVHINQLLSGECRLVDYHMLVLPGGFSYGDDLGAGVVWALDLQHRLQAQMAAFVADGRPVLGICNGFQTLVKSGLLPGGEEARSVTLTYNQSGQFECRWVYLQPNPDSPSLFTRGLTAPIYCPVAHGEGRFAIRDESVTAVLQSQNLIPLAYVKRNGAAADYPTNPNGSVLNIAALCNSAGNVMGLMPHPENHIFPWQHPRHHRGEQGLLGLRLFENGMKHA